MSNHYHLVVKLAPKESERWTNDEVLRRWTAIFRGPLLIQRHQAGELLSAAEEDTVASIVRVFRDRLSSLSWFMKCLNEPIARKANAEDLCTGHFWEARFHSQALRSDAALLAAMAYVDLNPIRAQIARTPEESDYTSIKARLAEDEYKEQLAQTISAMVDRGELNHFDTPIRPLMPFPELEGKQTNEIMGGLPMRETAYLMLVDHTGRVVNSEKRGRIDPTLSHILERLKLSAEQWTAASTAFRQHYRNGELRLTKTA